MKRFLAVAVVATMGLFYAGTSNAVDLTYSGSGAGSLEAGSQSISVSGPGDYAEGMTANGVAGSRHNLGAFGRHIRTRGAGGDETGTTQICVFCHTPHHSNTDARPLWNRNMPNSDSYIGYGNTIGGSTVAKPASGSSSLACLSCHDGVTTFDNLVNAPGKGLAMANTTQSWTFWDHGGAATVALGTSVMPAGDRTDLGTDLTNDHPVNVKYLGYGSATPRASLRSTGTTIGNIDLTIGLEATTAYYKWMTTNRWSIGGFVTSGATIADLLRSNTATGPKENVECASCHDPHFSNGSYPEYTRDANNDFTGLNAADGVFLRRVGGNMGSGVCRTCHNK